MADAVRQLLSSEGLADFLPALEQLGGTAMAYLSLLRSKDLLDIGMSAEQAAQLLSAVAAAVAPTVLAPPPPSSPPPARRPLRADDLSFDELVTMLRRENAARLAPSTQAAYRAAEADGLEQVDGDWMEVTEQLQRACVREALSPAAPPHELARGLARLRGAPHEPQWSSAQSAELASISLWRRYNRARDGALREGQPFPDVELTPLAGGCRRPLSSFGGGQGATRPLVVVCGSYS